jgi:hypothetical protein
LPEHPLPVGEGLAHGVERAGHGVGVPVERGLDALSDVVSIGGLGDEQGAWSC